MAAGDSSSTESRLAGPSTNEVSGEAGLGSDCGKKIKVEKGTVLSEKQK